MLKKHWPIPVTFLVLIISIIFVFAASHATDTGDVIFYGMVIFMLLFPFAGAVIGGWYGRTIRSPLKWLLAPAVFLGSVLFITAVDLLNGTESIDMASNAVVGSFSGITCLCVEIVVSACAFLVGKMKEKHKAL